MIIKLNDTIELVVLCIVISIIISIPRLYKHVHVFDKRGVERINHQFELIRATMCIVEGGPPTLGIPTLDLAKVRHVILLL